MRRINVFEAAVEFADNPESYRAGKDEFGARIGASRLGPGDVTAFPTGPAGAHKTTNNGDESVRMVMFSNRDPLGYTVYPDPDKVSYWTPSPDPADNVRVGRGQRLDYFDGEL